jgi:hypothetical protein
MHWLDHNIRLPFLRAQAVRILAFGSPFLLALIMQCAVPETALALSSRVNISQGYKLNGTAVNGTLVATDRKAAGTIVPATLDMVNNLVGVIVQDKESLLTVGSGTNQTHVAISGMAYALVSNINGDIRVGDRVTTSPLSGIGMRATNPTRVLGMAQSDLASATDVQTVAAKDKSGKDVSVKVGRVLVSVNIGYYVGPADSSKSFIPKPLQDTANALAGKQVSPIRIIIGGVLLLLSLIISIILVYSSVRSSIISIGRNPLSQPAIRKGLAQVLGFVGVILLVTLISVYLILSR